MKTSLRQSMNYRSLLFFEAVSLAAGLLNILLGGTKNFSGHETPLLAVSHSLFPVIWIVLYLMIGFAAYLIWSAFDVDSPRVLRLYLLQLVLACLWHLFVFRFEWRLFSFFWALFLVLLVSLMMAGFRYISRPAYYLIVLYLLWMIYVAYLNLAYYLLNLP